MGEICTALKILFGSLFGVFPSSGKLSEILYYSDIDNAILFVGRRILSFGEYQLKTRFFVSS